MNSLKDIEHDVVMHVPPAVGMALKDCKNNVASSEQAKIAIEFIVRDLAGIGRLGFSMPGEASIMAWYAGRRFVGLQIERIIAEPIDDQRPELPPARTMTERARRRGVG